MFYSFFRSFHKFCTLHMFSHSNFIRCITLGGRACTHGVTVARFNELSISLSNLFFSPSPTHTRMLFYMAKNLAKTCRRFLIITAHTVIYALFSPVVQITGPKKRRRRDKKLYKTYTEKFLNYDLKA